MPGGADARNPALPGTADPYVKPIQSIPTGECRQWPTCLLRLTNKPTFEIKTVFDRDP